MAWVKHIGNCRREDIPAILIRQEKFIIFRKAQGEIDAIIRMLGGEHVKVDISTFQNDIVSLDSRDDVLTFLVHLGYLAYDADEEEVYIPNLEVASIFKTAIKSAKWNEVSQIVAPKNTGQKLF